MLPKAIHRAVYQCLHNGRRPRQHGARGRRPVLSRYSTTFFFSFGEYFKVSNEKKALGLTFDSVLVHDVNLGGIHRDVHGLGRSLMGKLGWRTPTKVRLALS